MARVSVGNFTSLEHLLWERVPLAKRHAQQVRDDVVLSCTVCLDLMDPVSIWGSQNSQATETFLFRSPVENRLFYAFGVTQKLTSRGTERFAGLRHQLEHLQPRWVYTASDTPRLFGGFAFTEGNRHKPWTDWEDSQWVLPRFILEVAQDNTCTLTINMVVGAECETAGSVRETLQSIQQWVSNSGVIPAQQTQAGGEALPRPNSIIEAEHAKAMVLRQQGDGDATSGAWKQLVHEAASVVRNEGMRKVVLARRSRLTVRHNVSIPRALQRLMETYPESYVFAIRHAETSFIGVTPERLVRVVNGEVFIDALAGTTRRGKTLDEDTQLGHALLHSQKDRKEHAVVVERVCCAIEGLVENVVVVPEEPVLKPLANLQHLYTPIHAQAKPKVSVLDFVEQLHPTPAVAGEPRLAALAYIRDHEGMDRGWYAAPIGWMSPTGDGEFVVALRSALIEYDAAYLYAGAGIMADSDPDLEWEETELKLQAMRTALQVESEEAKP